MAFQGPTSIKANGWGIPWAWQHSHYIDMTTHSNGNAAVRIYTEADNAISGSNYVYFVDRRNGQYLGRQEAQLIGDFFCALRATPGGIFLDISNYNPICTRYDPTVSNGINWVPVSQADLGSTLLAAATSTQGSQRKHASRGVK
jgi:hypothetical protein